MRVIAGKARSLPLKTVPGLATRPTTDRIKETLFNILQPELLDCRFLDLFAGSGAIGIEALSRGAFWGVFVEKDPRAVNCILQNLQFTHLKEQAEVIKADVLQGLSCLPQEEPFDVIFMDPPYGKELEKQVHTYLKDSSLVTPDTLLVVETDLKTDLSYAENLGFQITKTKKYKTNAHYFLCRK